MVVKRELIPVVVYYRCSSKQQELSVDQQRAEVVPYCKSKGYQIIREYVDEGKSASKNQDKRDAFNRMIRDSAKLDYRVVVCYDAARFTRFDNIDGSNDKRILRQNGIFLDTLKEGEFNWSAPEGRWKDMAYCENNKAAALNLSKDSLRGRRAVLALGYWPNGVIPYGYDREVTDGVRTIFYRRYEKCRKGRGWHTRLVVNDEERPVVEFIFAEFLKKKSRRQIAVALNAKGYPAPRGQHGRSTGGWDGYNVDTILTEKAYIGIASIGNRRSGRVAHNRVEQTEREGACPVIIDPATFQRAQDFLSDQKTGRTRPAALVAVFVVFKLDKMRR